MSYTFMSYLPKGPTMTATPPPTARHATDAMTGPFVVRFTDVDVPMAFPAEATRGEVRRDVERTLATGQWGDAASIYPGQYVCRFGVRGVQQAGPDALEEVTR